MVLACQKGSSSGLGAAIVALEFNSVPVIFGDVGTPTNTAFATVQGGLERLPDTNVWRMALTKWSAVPMAVGTFMIMIGVVFDIIYLVIATFIGPELCSLLTAVITLFIVMATTKKGFLVPKEVWTFGDPAPLG